MMQNYPAFLIKSSKQFMVTFPDLEGCLAFAPSAELAFSAAQEVLSAHLSAMIAEKIDVPEPSDLMAVQPDSSLADKVATKMLIPVNVSGRTVRTNITIEEGLLSLIDKVTTNRSVFFAEAAQHELERRHSNMGAAIPA